jgi:hypothetical protein
MWWAGTWASTWAPTSWRYQVKAACGATAGNSGTAAAAWRAGQPKGDPTADTPYLAFTLTPITPPRLCPPSAAGRFAGPLVVAGVTHIATPAGQTNYCTDLVVDDGGNVSCDGPPAQQCIITGDEYYVQVGRLRRRAGRLGGCKIWAGGLAGYKVLSAFHSNSAHPVPPSPRGLQGCVLYNVIPMYAAMAGEAGPGEGAVRGNATCPGHAALALVPCRLR